MSKYNHNDVNKIIRDYHERAELKGQLVTVFMLTHNRVNYAKLMIESVLDQTYDNYQFIILDNCSEDDTEQMIKEFQAKDERVIYIYRKSVVGDSNTDFALKICTTKYFIILHDDDIIEKDYLDRVLFEMENNKYDVMGTSAVLIDDQGKEFGVWIRDGQKRYVWKNDEYLIQYLKPVHINMLYPSVIYRTSFYKTFINFGGTPEAGPCGDQIIWMQTEKTGGTVALLNERLYRYRRHRGSESVIGDGSIKFILFDYLLREPLYKDIVKQHIFDVGREVLYASKVMKSRYKAGSISKDEFYKIKEHYCVNELKKHLLGIPFYLAIMMFF